MTIRIGYSEISGFLACAWEWDKQYHEGWQPKITRRSMELGDGVHYGISEWLLNQRTPEDAMSEWREERESELPERKLWEDAWVQVEETAQLASGITGRALDFLGWPLKEPAPGRSKWMTACLEDGTTLVETEIEMPLGVISGEEIVFVAHIDWAAVDLERGGIWVLDHKVRATLGTQESEPTRLQTSIYQYVLLRGFGVETQGAATIQMRDCVPKLPSVNKNGQMSRSEIATDWATYRQALIAESLNPAHYADMYAKLKDKEFFRVVRTYRNKQELVNTWDMVVIPTIQAIVAWKVRRGDMTTYLRRSLGSLYCGNCDFRDPCLEELRGRVYDFEEKYTRET